MPYCKTAYSIPERDSVLTTLSVFTRECFVLGQAAYQIDKNRFSIDAGENDIRALYDEESGLVKFFCRYDDDMPKYEKKLKTFAMSHDIEVAEL